MARILVLPCNNWASLWNYVRLTIMFDDQTASPAPPGGMLIRHWCARLFIPHIRLCLTRLIPWCSWFRSRAPWPPVVPQSLADTACCSPHRPIVCWAHQCCVCVLGVDTRSNPWLHQCNGHCAWQYIFLWWWPWFPSYCHHDHSYQCNICKTQ